MITTITLHNVVCDLCKQELNDEYEESESDALNNAHREGWETLNGSHVCPECLDKPEPVFVDPNQLSLF